MDKYYLSKKEVRKIAGGIGESTLWRWTKSGSFPTPKQIGPNRVGWLSTEVEEWMETRPDTNIQEVAHV